MLSMPTTSKLIVCTDVKKKLILSISRLAQPSPIRVFAPFVKENYGAVGNGIVHQILLQRI